MDHSLPKPEFYKAPLDIYEYHGMPYMRLGNSGSWAPRIGLGTWKFGRPETGDEARVVRLPPCASLTARWNSA